MNRLVLPRISISPTAFTEASVPHTFSEAFLDDWRVQCKYEVWQRTVGSARDSACRTVCPAFGVR
jgi:hypothetical protein